MGKFITIPFTEPFIERLADHVQQEYWAKGFDLRRLGIVFGGRRPGLFLKRALARRIKDAFFAPHILAIDDFMSLITAPQKRQGLLDLDNCYVVYQLAEQYAPHVLKGREGFVHFLPWAREILRFIEQLDLEDAPEAALKTFQEHAALGFNVPPDINRLLESLLLLRQQYHKYLDQNKRITRGFRYLSAAHLISQTPLNEFDHILFCNFFYMHRTETAVIKHLFNRNKATLLVQGDQRRWPALTKMAEDFGQSILEGKEVTPTKFQLKLHAAFDLHAQAGLVSEILKDIDDINDTVIVLPNPDSMMPLLSAVGEQLKEFNISLGYPLRRSSLYALLESIVQAHRTMKGPMYYSRDYLRVLRHPLVKNLELDAPAAVLGALIHKLEDALTGALPSALSGQIYVTLEEILKDERLFEEARRSAQAMDSDAEIAALKKLMQSIHWHLFGQWENVKTFIDLAQILQVFTALMENHSGMAQYPLNERVSLRLQEIAGEWAAAGFGQQAFAREDILRIMQERLGRELVAFSGSPLRGLQVLGLLETRSLSFRHVIVLDVNERTLPDLNVYEPLIPREVMINLSLDRLEWEEEIQRYQFMRLISSAQDVHLIYLERPDKERSRFIEELIWEQEQKAGRQNVIEIERPAFQVALNENHRLAAKTPAILEYLKTFKFSASSLNTYLRNPYEFYLNYVLGLREKEDLLDDPESRQVGVFIHDLLQDAFKPWIGKKPLMDAAFRRHFLNMFEIRFHQSFGRGLRSDAFLIRAVIEHRLKRFLDVEAERVEAEVKELMFIERKFEDVIGLSSGPANFQYRVDRVERLNDGTILILDYKTGGLDVMPSHFEPQKDLSREALYEQIGSFQMPLYLYYLDKQYPGESVNAALYNLKTMEMKKILTSKTILPRPELIANFVQALDALVGEIFNPEIPFIDDGLDVK